VEWVGRVDAEVEGFGGLVAWPRLGFVFDLELLRLR
jgi:hypothetical protein